MKLLFVAMTVLLGWQGERYETANLVFTPAYVRSDDIEFDAPVHIDWEALARSYYGNEKLANPDRDEIRKRWSEIGGASTIEYNADLPQIFRSGAFYLLAESRSGFLGLTKLTGTVTYESDKDAQQISTPTFSGSVHGRSSSQPADAGFVLYSPSRPRVRRIDGLTVRSGEPRLLVRREGDQNVLALANRGKAIVVDRKPMKYPVLQSATLFTFEQNMTAYLLIRWVPDKACVEACCEHAYSLYRVSDGAKLVLENFYDCDV